MDSKFKLPDGMNIVARSMDEYTSLEGTMKAFLGSYGLKCQGIIHVSLPLIDGKGANIFPREDGCSAIEEVIAASEPARGQLVKASSSFVLIDLNDVRYLVKLGPTNKAGNGK